MNTSFENTNAKRITSDFQKMINIVIWNSLGFFFLDFLLSYVTSQLLGASGIEIGFIFSVQIIGNTISAPMVGFLTDKFPKKVLILIGSFGRGFAYIILYLAMVFESILGVALGTFSLGFLAGFFWIPLNTLISEKSNIKYRSFAFGKRSRATGIGSFYGAFIGFGLLLFTLETIPENSFRTLFVFSPLIVFCCANIYAGIVFLLHVDETMKFNEESFRNSQEMKTKNFIPQSMVIGLILLLFVLFLEAANGSFSKPFLNIYLLNHIENDPKLAALAYAPSGFVSMMIAPKLGEIADHINPYFGISIASFTGAVTTFLVINTNNLLIFTILLVIDVTIITTAGLIIQNILSRVSKTHRGKIFGAQSGSTNLGMIIGPLIGGIVWDLNSKAPFIISIFVEFSLIPFFLLAIYTLKGHLEKSSNS